MRITILFCIFALSISRVCFAQSNQSESLTITTYYPSPYGEYKTLRLNPSQQPVAGSMVAQPGTMYFNDTTQKLFIFNGSGLGQWEKIGSGGASVSSIGSIADSGQKVWPDTCPGTLTTGTIAGGHGTASLCSVPWLKKITFTKTFSSAPRVFVSAEALSGSMDSNMDDYYTCGEHSTDELQAYAENVTATDFDLRIGSSASLGSGCCVAMWCSDPSEWRIWEYYGKGEASWMAIGN